MKPDSIATLERYTGTIHQAEAVALVLIHAAYHASNKDAVWLLDQLREELFAEPSERIRQ